MRGPRGAMIRDRVHSAVYSPPDPTSPPSQSATSPPVPGRGRPESRPCPAPQAPPRLGRKRSASPDQVADEPPPKLPPKSSRESPEGGGILADTQSPGVEMAPTRRPTHAHRVLESPRATPWARSSRPWSFPLSHRAPLPPPLQTTLDLHCVPTPADALGAPFDPGPGASGSWTFPGAAPHCEGLHSRPVTRWDSEAGKPAAG